MQAYTTFSSLHTGGQPTIPPMHNDSAIESSEKVKSNQLRKGRMRFTPEQIHVLERRFQEQHYLLPADRKILALALRMTERQVKTWFQNKRAQYKRTRPLVRNPIYHTLRPPYGRQLVPFNTAGFTQFSLVDLSALCVPAYPTSPTHVQMQSNLLYHPLLPLASPVSR